MINDFIEEKFKISLASKIKNMGLLTTKRSNSLSYFDDVSYLPTLINNKNVVAVLTCESLCGKINKNKDLEICVVDSPKELFYSIYNSFNESLNYEQSVISDTAQVASSATIASRGVVIESGVEVGHNVVVCEGTHISKNVKILSNTVIGVQDIEAKMSDNGIIDVYHNGGVFIEENVIIGANCTIDRGIYGEVTQIGYGSRVSNNTLIGHNVSIGKSCLLLACTICGSARICDRVRVSPGAVVSSEVTVNKNAEIKVGAVVIEDVPENSKRSGNFAVEHLKMLKIYSLFKKGLR